MSETYGQFCPMAAALDQIGQRWTLLILRDLSRTPLRFSDLQAINPTLSPTLLSTRLRQLEARGLIERRTVRGPARVSVYALCEPARPLIRRILTALVELGAHLLETGPPLERPEQTLAEQMRLNAHFVLARASELEGYFLFDLNGWKTHVVIEGGELQVPAKAPRGRRPDAVARFPLPTTMVRIMGRADSVEAAEGAGRLVLEGDADAMRELLGLLSFAD